MNQSVASSFELYLARADLRPSSIRFKRQSLAYFIKWFGDMPAGQVTPAIAEDYKVMLATGGRSKRTANGHLANFMPFWNWLRRHGSIRSSPFEAVKLYRVTEIEHRPFSSEELARLMRISSDLWRLRICLGLLGCRRGEMLNIQVKDIHLPAGEHDDIQPHILLAPKTSSSKTWAWGLKDHACRYVGLPERMCFDGVVVDLHTIIRQQIASLHGPESYLCVEEKYVQRCAGKEVVYDPTGNFQRMFRALQKRAQIQPLKRYHELRAAFATALIDHQGLSRAADALGHASTQTTRKYDRKSRMSLVSDINVVTEKCYKSNVS